LFGISNQLLATVALCVATTIIIKMNRARFAWVTFLPLAWLATVTFTASFHKIFNSDPHIGFLAQANALATEVAASAERAHEIPRLIFNARLDAAINAVLVLLVAMILVESALEWARVISGRKTGEVKKAHFVPT